MMKNRILVIIAAVLVGFSRNAGMVEAKALGQNGRRPFIVLASDRVLDGSDHTIRAIPTSRLPNNFPIFNIWTINTDGSATPLTKLISADSGEPAWSPDGRKVAFTSSRALDGRDAPNGNAPCANIWVMNADGTGAKPLTRLTKASSSHPVWAPDGTRIAFVSTRALDGSDTSVWVKNIWVMNSEGAGAKPLTVLRAAESLDPAWSPDGDRIAFLSTRALDGSDAIESPYLDNIWIMHADGSSLRPLTMISFRGRKPRNDRGAAEFNSGLAWSPDGSRIAFSSRRPLTAPHVYIHHDPSNPDYYNDKSSFENSGSWSIWIVKPGPPASEDTDSADGSTATVLFAGGTNGFSYGPRWAPDGSKLVFSSSTPLPNDLQRNHYGVSNIWVVNVDGSAPAPLTKLTLSNAVGHWNPVWSPDGTKILFESSRALEGRDDIKAGGTTNIWTMNSDGSDLVPWTKLRSATSRNASWRP